MRVTTLELQNFRSFEHLGPITLKQINVLIGPNNSGKTSILRALHLLQHGCAPYMPEVRVNAETASVKIGISGNENSKFFGIGHAGSASIEITIATKDRASGSFLMKYVSQAVGSQHISNQIPSIDPVHFVVPLISKRKTGSYQEDVRQQFAMQIGSDMSYLAAKLSRLANPGFPEYELYSKTCKAILGFVVTAIPSPNGQRPGIYLPDRQTIPIEQMGEGVPNIVAFLADLALSRDKLFLIEEPENDLHPEALKSLLELIVESSSSNQFVISTHSNIVVRYLAAPDNSILYNVTTEQGRLPPVANVEEVERGVGPRLKVLRDLGYSFSDFDLWDGWLILEESSAERIIRDYLIPWFAPKLTRLRTVAAGGISEVEPTFNDLLRLVRFTHLEEVYRNSTWIIVDGDQVGIDAVYSLRSKFKEWQPERFAHFSEAQFERYYPAEFSMKVQEVLSLTDKRKKRDAKKELLDEVRSWLDADEIRGKAALEISAKELIENLRNIERTLLK